MLVHSYPLLLSLYKGEGRILIVPLIDHVAGYSIDAEWYENISDTDNAKNVGNGVLRAVAYIRNSPLSSLTPKEREDNAALNSYQVDAVGYIMKPIKYTEVKRAIDRAKISINYRRDAQKAKKRYLDIKISRNNVTIDLEKVVYIEKRRNQCVFHLEDGEYICYETLSKIYERLDHDSFIYTHQGFIASFHHIKEVKRNAVCFGRGVEIPISRKHYEPVKAMHMDKIYRLREEKNHSQNHS